MKHIGALATAMALMAGAALAAPAASADPTSPGHPGDAYNLAPASRTVAPARVYKTTGTVQSASNVLYSKATSLVGAGASITLDFGEGVGGLVSVHFPSSAPAGQKLGLAFTESSQYVGTTSDATNGGSAADGTIDADVVPGGTWR